MNDNFLSEVMLVPEEPKPVITEDDKLNAWLDVFMQQFLS